MKQTFTAAQLSQVSSGPLERLAEAQQQTLTATQEFTEGLRQRVGDVPPLNAAIASMQGAVDALQAGLVVVGQGLEESALASLIEARQNLRQILKMSDSAAAAAACRSFDRQQQQKLRPPEQARKPEEKQAQEQLAQACEQLEQLAQQQEQWSQQACPSPSSSSSSSRSAPPASPPDAARRQELAQEQQTAIQQAEQIGQQLRASQRSGQLAEQRLDAAAEQMQEALDKLGAERNSEAGEAARRAAEQLRELGAHLEALNQPDFAQRLARTGNLARQLADSQQQLARAMQQRPSKSDAPSDSPSGNPSESPADSPAGMTPENGEEVPAESGSAGGSSPAEQQRGLGRRAEELDELTARLAAEALDQQPEIQRMIAAARQANPPGELAGLMEAAAEDLDARRNARAAQAAELAANGLNQLAEDLRTTHERLTQPDVEQLLAAEQRAAELLQKLLDSRGAGERALARSQLDDLQRSLSPLAAGDRRLAEAQQALQSGDGGQETAEARAQRGGTGTYEQTGESRPAGEPRLEHSDQVLVSGLRRVTNVLQTMIQEAILDRALAEPDDAVPPGYERMVEEYYRALSEDLRE